MKYTARIVVTNSGAKMTVCQNCGRLPHKGTDCNPQIEDGAVIRGMRQELRLTKDVLGNLIAWLPAILGQRGQEELLERLYPDGSYKTQ